LPPPLARRVLHFLVINHFHKFDVKFDVKQRVCSELGVAYKPIMGANPRTKLITPRTGKR